MERTSLTGSGTPASGRSPRRWWPGRRTLPLEQVKGWFCNETGYQTPKLATRAAVFQGGAHPAGAGAQRVGPARGLGGRGRLGERKRGERGAGGGRPGGAGLTGSSPSRTGRTTTRRSTPGRCASCSSCAPSWAGEFRENLETSESGWFSLNELPELDLEKTTPEQLRMCFEARGAEHWETRLE